MTTNFGSGRGAIAGCHCSVLWLGEGRVTANFGGADVVPLQGAIAVCHCSVLWLGGRVTTNFGGVDVVPLLGAVVVCYGGEGGDNQFWGSGRGALDNTKIGFCYRGVYAGIIFEGKLGFLGAGRFFGGCRRCYLVMFQARLFEEF